MIRNTHAVPIASNPYSIAATSPKLRQLLVPEDPFSRPHATISCDATLVLQDRRGSRSLFRRWQTVEFLQNGVSALLDRAWGEGVILTNYRHSAGLLVDAFKEDHVRNLVVGLKAPKGKGERLS